MSLEGDVAMLNIAGQHERAETLNLGQIRVFLERANEIEFVDRNQTDLYEWVERALRQSRIRAAFEGARAGKRNLSKITGLSRAGHLRPCVQHLLPGPGMLLNLYASSRYELC
jgi:hypothetical protein